MKTLVSKLWKFLQSRNLALVLLAGLIASVILARLFNVTLVSSSWAFLALTVFLGLNTLVCSISRIAGLLKRTDRELDIITSTIAGLKNRAEIQTPRSVTELTPAVKTILQRGGYKVIVRSGNGTGNFFAKKGMAGDWGSIAFHFGLVVVLLGVLYSRVGRFEGLMSVTEGQTVTDQSQDYLAILKSSPLGETHWGFQLRLDKLQPTYDEGNIGIDYAANMTILENGNVIRKTTVRVNQPVSHRGTTFLLERYGFAPHFILKDEDGKEWFNSFVNLRVLEPDSEDSFNIFSKGMNVVVRFYPDMILVDGRPRTQSLRLNNPAMYLTVRDGSGELFAGLAEAGSQSKFSDMSISFDQVRYWTQYRVVQDTAGQTIIFTGFWLGTFGMLARYIFIDKRLWITAESRDGVTKLVVGGFARQFDSLYSEEFTKIVNKLEKET